MTALNSLLFLLLALIVTLLVASNAALPNPVNHSKGLNSQTNLDETPLSYDPDQPLILTPYLDRGDIETARSLSKVGKLPNAPYIPSYSGFFTVDKNHGSNMLFWFFPAQNNNTEAPVILWLDGGPGETGLFGLYTVNGPYIVYQNLSVGLRPQTWNREFHMIYVDSPVGTGFSFTNDDGGYVTNEDELADDLYEFLQQFFMLFSEYSSNDFYVLGESYAGKFVAAMSYKIHSAGPPSQVKFKGLSIGNGLCDPKTQMNYSDYYYQLGLVDSHQAAAIKLEVEKAVKDIDEENFNDAFFHLNNIVQLIPDLANPNYLLKFAGYSNPYNFLYTQQASNRYYFVDYIELPEFRKAIHIGNTPFSNGQKVFRFLSQDIMKTVRHKLVPLLNNYKILIYNGQLDLSMPFTLMKDFLSTVDWKFSDDLKKAERKIWKLDGKVAGYVHTVGDFYLALVRLAGHLVPYDQPDFALDLITRFIKGIPYA